MTDSWVKGVDVSHYQSTDPNFARQVKAEGTRFAYVKVSQGTGFRDKSRQAHASQMTAAGIAVGPYHFYDFAADPITQADNMVEAMKGVEWKLPPVLDAEKGTAGSKSATAVALLKFLQRVEQRTGRRPVVYTYAAWWSTTVAPLNDFLRYPLWIARYPAAYASGTVPARGATTTVPAPWTTWAIWQYTDGAHWTPVVDRNICSPTAFAMLTDAPAPAKWVAPAYPGIIRPYDRGPRVRTWKLLLKAAGFGLMVDPANDRYGLPAQLATKKLQYTYFRSIGDTTSKPDAVVGPKTWAFVCARVAARKAAGKA